MSTLDENKLHVTFQEGTNPEEAKLPRRYTLTHSDLTGELFMTIGSDYDRRQTAGFYTRLMRDEVLAELVREGSGTVLHIYCHVSGGIAVGPAGWRNAILHGHMPLVIEALHKGEERLLGAHPELEETEVRVHFRSRQKKYDRIENRGRWGGSWVVG